MSAAGQWFPLQIKTLCSDYSEYNRLLQKLIHLSETPLKSDFELIFMEEKKISSKILNEERILSKWLQDVPDFAVQFQSELNVLQELRNQSSKLRNKGRSSLKTGLTLLERERRNVDTGRLPKSSKKETAPRLIDIEL
ncbi:MAG: hypothetical protein PQJ58_13945 [Spirochaetales bacterium]|nr:hypothetical protein [Spirochaetales bacterium]